MAKERHAALRAAVGEKAHIDGAYDKMYVKLHDPAFPLRLLPPPLPVPSFRIMMTWHERSHRDPAHEWLRELARRLTVEAVAERRGSESAPAPG